MQDTRLSVIWKRKMWKGKCRVDGERKKIIYIWKFSSTDSVSQYSNYSQVSQNALYSRIISWPNQIGCDGNKRGFGKYLTEIDEGNRKKKKKNIIYFLKKK